MAGATATAKTSKGARSVKMTKTAASPKRATKGTGTVARAAKATGTAIANTAGRIAKGCVVVWRQRTRTGENTYEGIVQSGVTDKGRRTVKLISNGSTMQPMNKWLEYKGPAPAANA